MLFQTKPWSIETLKTRQITFKQALIANFRLFPYVFDSLIFISKFSYLQIHNICEQSLFSDLLKNSGAGDDFWHFDRLLSNDFLKFYDIFRQDSLLKTPFTFIKVKLFSLWNEEIHFISLTVSRLLKGQQDGFKPFFEIQLHKCQILKHLSKQYVKDTYKPAKEQKKIFRLCPGSRGILPLFVCQQTITTF